MTAGSMSHPQLIRLAVAALDFDLTGPERRLLDAHLPGCAECRSMTSRSRADAAAIASIAFVPAPPRVRATVLDRAARTRTRRPAWNLALVAALLAALLAGLALGAGALLQLRNDGRSPISWQAAPVQASITGDAASLAIEQVIAGNGLVLAAGRQSGGTLLLSSRDGRAWTAVGDAPAGATSFAFVSVSPRASQFAALGETVAGLPAVWWSPDGAAWTEEIVDDAPGSVTSLATVDDTIALAGYHRVLSSTELPEDTRRPVVWRLGPRGWETLAMAGIAEGDGAPGVLLDSPRGLVALGVGGTGTWVLPGGSDAFEPIGGDPGVLPAHAAWGAGRFVVAGQGADAPVVRVSEDLVSWRDVEALPDATGARIAALTYASGRFVAVGDGGRGALVWTSRDGLTWAGGGAIPGGAGAGMSDVTWLGETMIVVGSRGSDGAAWTGVVGE
jgi:hypothetical protein